MPSLNQLLHGGRVWHVGLACEFLLPSRRFLGRHTCIGVGIAKVARSTNRDYCMFL